MIPPAILKRRPGRPFRYRAMWLSAMGMSDGSWTCVEAIYQVSYRDGGIKTYWFHHCDEVRDGVETDCWKTAKERHPNWPHNPTMFPPGAWQRIVS